MSDLATFIGACLTAIGGTVVLSTQPIVIQELNPVRATGSGIADVVVVAPNYERAGRLFVTAQVNGSEVDLMIDTGASHTVLSRSDAHRLGIESFREVPVQTVSGRATLSEGKAREITIKGSTARDRPVLISDNTDVSLIGMDLLTEIGGTHIALAPLR